MGLCKNWEDLKKWSIPPWLATEPQCAWVCLQCDCFILSENGCALRSLAGLTIYHQSRAKVSLLHRLEFCEAKMASPDMYSCVRSRPRSGTSSLPLQNSLHSETFPRMPPGHLTWCHGGSVATNFFPGDSVGKSSSWTTWKRKLKKTQFKSQWSHWQGVDLEILYDTLRNFYSSQRWNKG